MITPGWIDLPPRLARRMCSTKQLFTSQSSAFTRSSHSGSSTASSTNLRTCGSFMNPNSRTPNSISSKSSRSCVPRCFVAWLRYNPPNLHWRLRIQIRTATVRSFTLRSPSIWARSRWNAINGMAAASRTRLSNHKCFGGGKARMPTHTHNHVNGRECPLTHTITCITLEFTPSGLPLHYRCLPERAVKLWLP